MSSKDHKTNPTTKAYQKMLDNRSRQLNTQDPKFSENKKDK